MSLKATVIVELCFETVASAFPAIVTPLLPRVQQTAEQLLNTSPEATAALVKLASDPKAPLPGRVVALFTLKQLDGKEAQAPLLKLAGTRRIPSIAAHLDFDKDQFLE